MSALPMPCDELSATLQRARADAREAQAEATRQRVYTEERGAFIVACHDCALKLPHSGETPWYVVFQDLLYLDNPGSWAKRRELFNILLTTERGRAWLADRATEHAAQAADASEATE
jgi:hypothetical protein